MQEKLIQIFTWEKISSLLQNPQENPEETVIVAGMLILMLLILLILGLLIFSIIKPASDVEKKSKKSRKKFWGIVGLIACFFLFAIASFSLFYTSSPDYCKTCHEMRPEHESWKKNSHANVTCLACHQKPGPIGWADIKIRISRMALLKTAKRYEKPITTTVNDVSCNQCHDPTRRKTVRNYGIKMSHKEPLEAGFRCTDCHNTAGHGKNVVGAHYPSMNDCIQCHTGEKISTDCNLCHTKDVGTKPRAQSADYPKVHLAPPTNCRGCHSIEPCTDCHGLEMPHPQNFREPEVHAKLAAFERKKTCQKCHDDQMCDRCHRFPGHNEASWRVEHGPKAQGEFKAGCLNCHNRSRDFCGLCH